jgi:hypothetical protein
MIDKSFIEKILSLEPPTVKQFFGLEYTDKSMKPVMPPTVKQFFGLEYTDKSMKPVMPPTVSPFHVATLGAIIDFCDTEVDSIEKCVLHIKNFAEVSLKSELNTIMRLREEYVSAQAFDYKFPFGKYMGVEAFIIGLQSSFIQDDTTANIMKLVGNMTKVSEVGVKDDGVTQRVEAKVGLAKVENISVPNPVRLRPYRTFIEIEQPASNFILRVNSDHQCALYEADGGAWQIEAMKNIKGFLEASLKAVGMRDNITILC